MFTKSNGCLYRGECLLVRHTTNPVNGQFNFARFSLRKYNVETLGRQYENNETIYITQWSSQCSRSLGFYQEKKRLKFNPDYFPGVFIFKQFYLGITKLTECKESAFSLHSVLQRIGLVKEEYLMMFFLLFDKKYIYCWYPLEAPLRGASNEYPQHMFLWRSKISQNYQQMLLRGASNEYPQHMFLWRSKIPQNYQQMLTSLCNTLYISYRTFPKLLDTLSAYNTCPKCEHVHLMCLKTAVWVTNNVVTNDMPRQFLVYIVRSGLLDLMSFGLILGSS